MRGQTTTEVETTTREARAGRAEPGPSPALAIAWCREEPGRVGEIALLPQQARPHVLGRGTAGQDQAEEDQAGDRARFLRQRPGQNIEAAPLGGSHLSRSQLRITTRGDRLTIENIGRCKLLLRGRPVDQCEIGAGDVVVLRKQLVLVCVERPPVLRAFDAPPAFAGAFGEADGFGLVGESPAIWRLREQLAFAAGRELHALILGESGSGKELAARALHGLSARGARPLVARNAATLPAGLVDAELFGNVRDYPNPGMRERPGLIGEADGSSLFLDEIGELPEDAQAHLLRALDSGGEYHRLGEARARSSRFRFIGATNRAPGALKHDVLARLTLRIVVPGLEDRREDIPLLARHLLRRAAEGDAEIRRRFFEQAQGGPGEPRVAPELVEALVAHPYTHHARELAALLWRAVAESRGDTIELGPELQGELAQAARGRDPAELTAEEIQACLERRGGVIEDAWRELGLRNRFALLRLIKKHGIAVRRGGR